MAKRQKSAAERIQTVEDPKPISIADAVDISSIRRPVRSRYEAVVELAPSLPVGKALPWPSKSSASIRQAIETLGEGFEAVRGLDGALFLARKA